MHLAPVMHIELYDPHLQLEAEEPAACADAHPPGFASAGIHGEIIGTIAAIDRLAAQWQRAPERTRSQLRR
ncbi:MAG TPA: hypothetical protein VJ047_12890 [Pseudomonas sp.]|nr:hypothetical protein [Pseudomonas sp.]